jgi:hypothetical protein
MCRPRDDPAGPTYGVAFRPEDPMRNSDLVVRISSFLMLFSAMWNGAMCLLWIAIMIWVLVGVLWFLPLLAVVVQFALAVLFLVTGHNKAVAIAPLLGLFASVCTFNLLVGGLELMNLALMIGSYVMRANEDAALAASA